MVLGERRNDAAPLPPVLREPVQKEDGIALSGLGDVHAQTVRELDDAVLDSGKFGEPGVLTHGGNLLVIR